MPTVGVLHPGEMGSALASLLRERGLTVLWASEDRSAATAERAAALEDAGTAGELAGRPPGKSFPCEARTLARRTSSQHLD